MCAFSPLYFSPLRLPFLSLAGCVRESGCTLLCVYVCVCERTRAGFPFEHLFDVAVYLFISPACEGPSSAVRATADRARVALSAIHQRGAFLTNEPVTLVPYSTAT